MAVSITAGQANAGQSYQSAKTFTQSTATAFQALSLRHDVNVLGMGTATGFGLNRYSLATTGIEGQEVLILCDATGEAKVHVPAVSGRMSVQASLMAIPAATAVDAGWASATGMWSFSASNQYLLVKVVNGLWEVVGGRGATMATAT